MMDSPIRAALGGDLGFRYDYGIGYGLKAIIDNQMEALRNQTALRIKTETSKNIPKKQISKLILLRTHQFLTLKKV